MIPCKACHGAIPGKGIYPLWKLVEFDRTLGVPKSAIVLARRASKRCEVVHPKV